MSTMKHSAQGWRKTRATMCKQSWTTQKAKGDYGAVSDVKQLVSKVRGLPESADCFRVGRQVALSAQAKSHCCPAGHTRARLHILPNLEMGVMMQSEGVPVLGLCTLNFQSVGGLHRWPSRKRRRAWRMEEASHCFPVRQRTSITKPKPTPTRQTFSMQHNQ